MSNARRMPDVTPGPLGSQSVDAIDLNLVELLRGNARLSYAELARQVGLSAPAVHERVGKLESSGVIRAYRAEVDPEAIGFAVTALIGIVEDSGGDTDDVLEAFRQMPEIESCYFMAGVESFMLKARVGTIAELERLIVRLNRTPGVASTRTGIALSTKWENRPQAPVPPAA
ncbi:transcriptional regulator, AsnC family [Micromonospora echinofusca]|uniref:Transcriptional regulator, AsnC family n=1 Tax=Micromonospora echinofusca TaxID=47858 RepID=A0A1C5GH77_MICEH|nr:transcriptional regulator, AsnC family [Micromonospora echinofusca]